MKRHLTQFFVILAIFLCPTAARADSSVDLTFFDVGEGDSALIQFPNGDAVLVDTGNLVSGIRVVRRLAELKADSIDKLFLTHPHPDHIGGAFALLQLKRVEHVFDNGEDLAKAASSEDVYRWYVDFVRGVHHATMPLPGTVFEAGGAKLKVLWPDSQSRSSDWNTNSLVLLLEFGAFRALLMGDGNLATEEALLQSAQSLKATLLKAGHHGASDTGSKAFIEAVQPELVVVSVNRGNIRGYPAQETLEKYRASGSRVLRTDEDGEIFVSAKKNGKFEIRFPSKH